MRVAIIGGKLQGVEATYLAKKTGWEVFLIDKLEDVPARGLCDEFFCLDISELKYKVSNVLSQVDFILPAMENIHSLKSLFLWAKALKKPIAFDPKSYQISSSKIESNLVFKETGIAIPKLWPNCELPLVVKPSGSSGSEGVFKLKTNQELQELKQNLNIYKNWVIQEFVDGPSFSIEVIGCKGQYQTYQVTELEMDECYDCKRVLAPAHLTPDLTARMEQIGETIAKYLNLSGIMDVEVILHDGELKVLEIDARLPSQTPTVVFKSTGINIVEILGDSYITGRIKQTAQIKEQKGVVYEHISVSSDSIKVCGEHIMSQFGPLKLISKFFGADEAITNYSKGKKEWVATLIITGDTRQKAWEKRCNIIDRIMSEKQLKQYIDLLPED